MFLFYIGEPNDLLASPLLSPTSDTFTEDSNSLDLGNDSIDLECESEVKDKLESLIEAATSKVVGKSEENSSDCDTETVSSESPEVGEDKRKQLEQDEDDDDEDDSDDNSEEEPEQRSLIPEMLEGNQEC